MFCVPLSLQECFPNAYFLETFQFKKAEGKLSHAKAKLHVENCYFFVKLRIEIQFDSKNAAWLVSKFDPVFILSIFCVISAKKVHSVLLSAWPDKVFVGWPFETLS